VLIFKNICNQRWKSKNVLKIEEFFFIIHTTKECFPTFNCTLDYNSNPHCIPLFFHFFFCTFKFFSQLSPFFFFFCLFFLFLFQNYFPFFSNFPLFSFFLFIFSFPFSKLLSFFFQLSSFFFFFSFIFFKIIFVDFTF
jgi:hypothetical protein